MFRSAGLWLRACRWAVYGDRILLSGSRPATSRQIHLCALPLRSPELRNFAAAGIPLLEARTLTRQDSLGFDDKHARDSAVVIQQIGRRESIGLTKMLSVSGILFGDNPTPGYRVVGIPAGMSGENLDEDPGIVPCTLPLLMGSFATDFHALIHTAGDPAGACSPL